MLQEGMMQNDFAKEAKVVRRASEYLGILLPETYGKILEILDTAQEYYSYLLQDQALPWGKLSHLSSKNKKIIFGIKTRT